VRSRLRALRSRSGTCRPSAGRRNAVTPAGANATRLVARPSICRTNTCRVEPSPARKARHRPSGDHCTSCALVWPVKIAFEVPPSAARSGTPGRQRNVLTRYRPVGIFELKFLYHAVLGRGRNHGALGHAEKNCTKNRGKNRSGGLCIAALGDDRGQGAIANGSEAEVLEDGPYR